MKGELFRRKPQDTKFAWVLDETKYLDLERVKKLRAVIRGIKDKAIKENKLIPIRNWFMVELGLFTGLRVDEMVNLKVSDLHIQNDQSSLSVIKGKGNKSRTVYIPKTFKDECLFYLEWLGKTMPQFQAQAQGQYQGESQQSQPHYLFANKKGQPLTKRALQKAFKKCLRLANLESHYHIHCLRHTYASFLYKSSNHNLRLVQEQLGHSSIRTTQVYANLMSEEIKEAVGRIYEG